MGLLEGSAFITGAASGIGEATAHALAEHGVTKLAITDVDPQRLERVREDIRRKWPGVDVHAFKLDVTKSHEVASVLADVVRRFGRLDIAVNSAGIGGTPKRTDDFSDEEWLEVVNVNMNGVFWCQREQIRIMLKQEDLGKKRGRGCIINVASLYGIVGPQNGIDRTSYSSTKHAVMGMTRADAQSHSGSGIRINAICPGYVITPLIDMGRGSDDPGHPLHTHKMQTPLRRLGDPDEVGDGVVFLASPLASFVNGTGLVVDGGYSAA
ncbi:Levodione reductase [Escovopsis weberi]|uniref:Levodione reductase n=1 Tax=Escovopsis weberi TaxID=150374 RepID=A0A0M8N100_ESCWE|nr:Levodione reductase [Escovopsis weberi]